MIEVKVMKFNPYNDSKIEKAVQEPIQKMINEGWDPKFFNQAGRYGGYFSAVFTRDTSELRSEVEK